MMMERGGGRCGTGYDWCTAYEVVRAAFSFRCDCIATRIRQLLPAAAAPPDHLPPQVPWPCSAPFSPPFSSPFPLFFPVSPVITVVSSSLLVRNPPLYSPCYHGIGGTVLMLLPCYRVYECERDCHEWGGGRGRRCWQRAWSCGRRLKKRQASTAPGWAA